MKLSAAVRSTCRPGLAGVRHRSLALLCLLLILGSAPALARPAGSPPVPELPPPGPSVFRLPQVIAWPEGQLPSAPAGFRVTIFAENLDHPRSLLVLPNGDVLVAQARTEAMGGMPPEVVAALTRQGVFGPSPNNILLLRQTPSGLERHELLADLNQPFGMQLLGRYLYVATTDALLRFPFEPGQIRIAVPAEDLADLPAGPYNNHWTRNLLASADGSRLLVAVGAGTNVNEEGVDPPDRAAIWSLRPDGTEKRLLATGLRNPVGLAFEPETGVLWTTVNERDGLGEDVPPDYLTAVVDGAFYGWPYVYFGTFVDPIQQRLNPAEVARAQQTARVPDLALDAHSVPLGLLFYTGESFPRHYRGGAFVARRGGGSRVRFRGFDVQYVPFAEGRPAGPPEAFLTGFLPDPAATRVHGRPVGLAMLADGSLLVADDAGKALWRVAYEAP